MSPFSGGFEIFGVLLVILAIVVLWSTVKIVPQGMNYTVENFGRYTRTLQPGLHILVPVMERVGHRMNMKEQVLDIPSQDVITRDNAMVRVNGVTFFQVINAARAAYEVDQLEPSIVNLTMTNIRTVMGSMDLDELLSNRDQINARLLQVLDQATEAWGIKVTRIEIKDIDPPRDLVDSMARQMKAEREKRAQILESEGLRQAAILRAEGEKLAVVLEAEGRKEAAFRDAEARERSAEAEAKATQLVSDAISKGNVQAINYFIANNYVKALESAGQSPEPEGHLDAARGVRGDRIAGRPGADYRRSVRRWTRGSTCAGPARQRSSRIAMAATRPLLAMLSPSRWRGRPWDCRNFSGTSARGTGSSSPSRCSRSSSIVPGVHFVWFGIAAVLVGALGLTVDIAWEWQLITFAIISCITVFFARRYAGPDVTASDEPDLNTRAAQYVGRVVTVEEAISHGRGKVRVGDTVWNAQGADAPRVRG